MSNLATRLYDDFIYQKRYLYLVEGLGNTLLITIFSLLLGVILGFTVALIRVRYGRGENRSILLRILNFICGLYLTVIRGTPIVVQLMIMYFVILASGAPLLIAILSFGINSGAYVAEVVRSGIQSIDRGQTEAGRSLGLSKWQTLFKIVLPQAVKACLPTYTSEFIVLIKETSVASFIAVRDMTKAGDMIRNATYNAWIPLLTCAVIYLILTVGLTKLFGLLEKRMAKSDR